jgi:chemotaxis protein MotB
MKKIILPILFIGLLSSCVAKKKYVALEKEFTDLKNKYQETNSTKENLEAKFSVIENRVDAYNEKINSLKGENVTLQRENSKKYEAVGSAAVISNEAKQKMRETLSKVNPTDLRDAKTLKDSLNLAISYNLKNRMNSSGIQNSNSVDIGIEQTMVMISVFENVLFNSASYTVKKESYGLLEKLANIIKSEPSIDVMIEGHADSRKINNQIIEDNWDLSVKRATSIVRILQDKYNVDGKRLIAAGRGSTTPLLPNTSSENMLKNIRTKILILPNIDKFFALLEK